MTTSAFSSSSSSATTTPCHRPQLQRQQRPHPVSPHRSASITGARHTARLALRSAALRWLLASRSAAICCATASAKHHNHANCARGRGRRISGTSIQSTTIVIPHARPSLYMRVHEGAHGACCLLRQLTCLTFTHTLTHTHTHTHTFSLCRCLSAVSLYLSRTSLYNPGLQPRSGEGTAATSDPGETEEKAPCKCCTPCMSLRTLTPTVL